MQFKIVRVLTEGKYYVTPVLVEYNDDDDAKAQKFGTPVLPIRFKNGNTISPPVTNLSIYMPFGFYKQDEADEYANTLKAQIEKLKKDWSELKDTWSGEETI